MAVLEQNDRVADPARRHALWVFNILRSLVVATPLHVILCVLLYVVSQIALLISILLPWKLLVGLSGEAAPALMPAFLQAYSGREQVLILGMATFVAFLLYVLCEAAISQLCGHGARLILSRHQKTGLFESHRQQASSFYRRLLRGVAAAVSFAGIAVWLAFAYPLLLLALASYLCGGLLVALWRRQAGPPAVQPVLSPELAANLWWGLGFLYAVGWVTADHWRGEMPGFIVAFISLLLLRQAIVLSAQIYRTHALLDLRRSKVDALFLANTPWQPVAQDDRAFQTLLEPRRRAEWVANVMERIGEPFDTEPSIRCRSVDGGKTINATATGLVAGQERSFLLKLHHASHEEYAYHEREILRVAQDDWPAPPFLGDQSVNGHVCLVFGLESNIRWMGAGERSSRLRAIREQLLSCTLPETLAERYDRSHPHLVNRMKGVDWSLLRLLAAEGSVEHCKLLEDRWPDLQRMLLALPRQVVIPRLHEHRIGVATNGPVICNWSRWRWEPVGAGWPRQASSDQLEEALQRAGARRSELRYVTAGQARLTTLLFEFDRLWRLRDFVSTLKLMPALCETIGMAETDIRLQQIERRSET